HSDRASVSVDLRELDRLRLRRFDDPVQFLPDAPVPGRRVERLVGNLGVEEHSHLRVPPDMALCRQEYTLTNSSPTRRCSTGHGPARRPMPMTTRRWDGPPPPVSLVNASPSGPGWHAGRHADAAGLDFPAVWP